MTCTIIHARDPHHRPSQFPPRLFHPLHRALVPTCHPCKVRLGAHLSCRCLESPFWNRRVKCLSARLNTRSTEPLLSIISAAFITHHLHVLLCATSPRDTSTHNYLHISKLHKITVLSANLRCPAPSSSPCMSACMSAQPPHRVSHTSASEVAILPSSFSRATLKHCTSPPHLGNMRVPSGYQSI